MKHMARLHTWRALNFISGIAMLLFVGTSCTNTKKALYFAGQNDGSFNPTAVPKPIIQPNDLLNITVSSLNPEASAIFNQPNNAGTNATTTTTTANGYLVDGDGNIQFPLLGSIKAAGMTKDELKNKLTKDLTDKKLLVDPIIAVRFLNFKVTVLGEVAKPTVITVPSEKISLLEAIGLAGDLTIYAQRDNVMVIREEDDGKKTTKRLNLNSTELFNSPYYYLKPNDVVYVEPSKAKVATTSRWQMWVPIVLSALSLGIIVVDRVK
jgi:Periplasmic protein involved in polysaccharide export